MTFWKLKPVLDVPNTGSQKSFQPINHLITISISLLFSDVYLTLPTTAVGVAITTHLSSTTPWTWLSQTNMTTSSIPPRNTSRPVTFGIIYQALTTSCQTNWSLSTMGPHSTSNSIDSSESGTERTSRTRRKAIIKAECVLMSMLSFMTNQLNSNQ